MAGYAQVTLVGVDLDHVTTSRHDPQAAQYGGTVTLRARSQGIDFTYAYPFSNRTSVLDAIDGATKSLLSELDSLSRACMDVTRQERDAIDEGDQNTEGPGDDLSDELPVRCHTPDGPPLPCTRLTNELQNMVGGCGRPSASRGVLSFSLRSPLTEPPL
jgi:hypothetical protein